MRHQYSPTWKNKVQGLITQCQVEIRRTTAIGMKMISASKANTDLHEAYENLGRLTVKAMKSKELEWRDPQVRMLMTNIEELEQVLHDFEDEVQILKDTDTHH